MKTLAVATCALTLGLTSFGGLTDGLIAHYKFDGDANDSSTNKNNGVVQGAILSTDRFENENRAYSFDYDTWIEVANSASLQSVTNMMTFSAWIKPSSSDRGFIPILCKGMAKRQFCFILQRTKHGDLFWINDRSGGRVGAEVRVQVPAGTCDRKIWYHVAVTYDGKTMKAFVNGQCIGSVAIADSFGGNTTSLYIGMDPPGWNEFMRGSLDEIRVYNRALSDKEIAEICAQEGRK